MPGSSWRHGYFDLRAFSCKKTAACSPGPKGPSALRQRIRPPPPPPPRAVHVDLSNATLLVHHAVGDPTGPFSFDAVYNNRS